VFSFLRIKVIRKLFSAVGLSLILLAAKSATAADANPESYSWSGPYVGLSLGGARGQSTAKDKSPPPGYNNLVGETWSFGKNAFTGGAQAGYNWQTSVFLIGGELDLGYLGLDHSKQSPQSVVLFGGDTTAKVKTDFYTAARLKLGLAADRLLLFGTGGWIGANSDISVVDRCTAAPCGPLAINARSDEFLSGWTAGGGFELGFTRHTSLKMEYMYIDLGTEKVKDLGVAAGFTFPGAWNVSTHAHLIRLGLNYRF
jgi:outer membrane immunogenic protein